MRKTTMAVELCTDSGSGLPKLPGVSPFLEGVGNRIGGPLTPCHEAPSGSSLPHKTEFPRDYIRRVVSGEGTPSSGEAHPWHAKRTHFE